MRISKSPQLETKIARLDVVGGLRYALTSSERKVLRPPPPKMVDEEVRSLKWLRPRGVDRPPGVSSSLGTSGFPALSPWKVSACRELALRDWFRLILVDPWDWGLLRRKAAQRRSISRMGSFLEGELLAVHSMLVSDSDTGSKISS